MCVQRYVFFAYAQNKVPLTTGAGGTVVEECVEKELCVSGCGMFFGVGLVDAAHDGVFAGVIVDGYGLSGLHA